jgi:transposase
VERAEAEAIYDAGRERCVEFIVELARRCEELAGRCERLEERVRKLEEQRRQSSRNSSQPPSEDPPKTRQQRRAEARARAKALVQADAERRRAGGQPGHRGAGRELLPEDQVDAIVDHYPERCEGCGHEFNVEERLPSGRPGRHQVAELPPIGVIVSEHRTNRLRCPRCRWRTPAALPAEVSGSAFGPTLQAAVVTMTARNRVSRRDMSELAGELFGIALAVGTVDAICQRAAAALAEPYERLVASVLESGAVNIDETGRFRAGQGRTMWTAATPTAAVFRIAEDRHRERLEQLLGRQFEGIVCSDRWWADDHLDPERRQVCREHLKRDFRRHAEGMAEQKLFGEAGLALTGRLFAAWRAFEEHGDRRRLAREMKPIQRELGTLLRHAGRKSKHTRFHRVFANKLLKIWPALWTFTNVEGVEPTNNAAERALRGPVIHRKLSHGSRSHEGERFIERALSTSVTCRLQGRSLFSYLAELISAHARGDPLPTLA